MTDALPSLVETASPDTHLVSHWSELLQTNALSLASRELIGTGKSLGQQININIKRTKYILNVKLRLLETDVRCE